MMVKILHHASKFKELTFDFHFLFNPTIHPPQRPPNTDFSPIILLLLTSSFAVVIVATATRGRRLTLNVNMIRTVRR